jgi:hypothetical protein
VVHVNGNLQSDEVGEVRFASIWKILVSFLGRFVARPLSIAFSHSKLNSLEALMFDL